MARYVILDPPAGSRREALFVRDGFAWPAFFLGLLWLLWHRLWAAALMVGLLLAVAISFAARAEAVGAGTALLFILAVYVGLEGQSMRIGRRLRQSWRLGAVIEAETLADAELRYFAADATRLEPAPVSASMLGVPSRPASLPLGLLGFPGSR